jgi:uncharacterized NAD(P)/FAD-binding protein YdhS
MSLIGVVAFPIRRRCFRVGVVSRLNRVSRSSIAIVGAGAAGTLTAARLIDEAGRRNRSIEVTLIDPAPTVGRGVAYSTDDNRHLLNVPVRKMTAYPEDGEHFARWLESHDGKAPDPCDYVPRGRYGQYLAHVLEDAQRRTPWAHVYDVRDRVIDLSYDDRRCRLQLGSGAYVEVEAVVLAVGHLGPELSWVPETLRSSPRFVADPWIPGALADVDPDGDVLLVGTGLTMVDTVRVLDRPGRVVHATSRHGVLPRRHTPGQLPVMEAPELPSPTPTLAELQGVMAYHAAKAVARYGDWRPAIDSIRAMTPRLWAGLSDADRADFVALDARWWDAARHRIPPVSAAALDAARDAERLLVHTARVLGVVETAAGLEVTLSDGETIQVAAVVNCAGPCGNPASSTDPLIRSLIDSGRARGGPLGIGLDTAEDGQLRDVDGRSSAPVWTLGSLRRGTLWESTAIPEIRDQAVALAKSVLGPELVRDHRPTDRYGLALSTTTEAADAWSRALHAICTLQHGAEAALREAVDADPGFAVGHAALALVGHEWGGGVDVDGALRAAIDAALYRGDARERSFVQAVVSRLTLGAKAGDRDLLRHVADHPLDAFAVSMALPTIAFSGLTLPVAESWALADRLALSYGDDWWFAGMLAFVRQEQERWDDADRLALRSMREVPGSGHAAHARTHVFYETGDHVGGLQWMDQWIDANADGASYAAHFSWHAALHELALEDSVAVRRRYAEQLAPPVVAGPRALVDSASLLWRCRMAGAWPEELPIEAVLASVPSCLLDHPATAFAAMHAVVALAAAGDVDAIGRLRRFAAAHPDPTYGELIVPLCDGFAAQVRGEPAVAAERLAVVVPAAGRLGGSAAQQEVIAETMVNALVESGQHDAARQFLERRLDRRPRPSDQHRLIDLT